MNKAKLTSIMVLFGDNQKDLAQFLGISLSRFNAKVNETGGAQFTQSEIACIKQRYDLKAEEVDNIFFNLKVS